MSVTKVILPTHPARWYQKPLWRYLEGGGKRAVCVWHRRSGKDDVAASWASVAALETQPAVYWHMLPEYAQARKAIWQAVNPHTGLRRIDEWFPQPIRKATREQEMMIEFTNGAVWQVVGSDNFDRLVGASVKGVVCSEWALANPLAWAYIRPILLENNGWALFISTPRGRNHLHALYEAAVDDPSWFAQILTANDTQVFSADALQKERSELIREMGEDDGDAKFRQEYLCDFAAALVGAYYTREFGAIDAEGRIAEVRYDPQYPVYTAWDLGVGDQTAIWYAQVDAGGTVRVIDFDMASGVTVDHYARLVLSKPYVYARHIFPHDADRTDFSAMGNQGRVAILKSLGVKPLEVLARDAVDDGIQAARRLLARSVFDRRKCAVGLAHLRQYRRAWNERYHRFDPKPLHDEHSDAADAFRYLALGLPRSLKMTTPPKPIDRYEAAERTDGRSRWAF